MSVLLVTATKVESKAVLDVFEKATGQPAKATAIDHRVYFDLGMVNGTRVHLARSEMGASGPGGSLQAVHKGIEALSPKAVIMVGISFGTNEQKQKIGDILVTEHLRLYELQKVGTEINLRGSKPDASTWLLNQPRMRRSRGRAPRFGLGTC